MNLDFEFVDIEGFRSFIGKPTVLELADYGPGLHFVAGRNEDKPSLGANGAGKSSLWAALTWCLYGQTADGLIRGDIRPWYWKGPTDVRVGVQVEERFKRLVRTKSHTIRRTHKTRELFIDDRMVGQEEVDRLIGLPFELFVHTILLGQGMPLFFDLSPREKLELFSTVMNLERWLNRSKAAGEEAKKLTREGDHIAGELQAVRREFEQVTKDLLSTKVQAGEWDLNQQTRLENADTELKDIEKRLDIIVGQRSKADLAFDGAETELRHIEKQMPDIRADLLAVERNYEELRSIVGANKQKLQIRENELADLARGGMCPTCGQSIKGTNLAKHRDELRAEIAGMKKSILAIPRKTIDLRKKYDSELAALEKAASIFKHKSNVAHDTLNQVAPEIAQLEADRKAIKSRQSERKGEANPYSEQLQSLRGRSKQLTADIRALNADLKDIDREAEQARFWVKGFKEVRLYEIEELLQELEVMTNSMVDDIGLRDWEVRYAIEKETKSGGVQRGIAVTILSPDNDRPVKWKAWSGGEGQRLRLTGALALSEVLLNHAGVDPGMEILDEPTQHLSSEGVQDLTEFLADRARRLQRQIWYVDHASIESAHFQTITTVTKTKGGSRLSRRG